jgi:hypothetical protein
VDPRYIGKSATEKRAKFGLNETDPTEGVEVVAVTMAAKKAEWGFE